MGPALVKEPCPILPSGGTPSFPGDPLPTSQGLHSHCLHIPVENPKALLAGSSETSLPTGGEGRASCSTRGEQEGPLPFLPSPPGRPLERSSIPGVEEVPGGGSMPDLEQKRVTWALQQGEAREEGCR